MNKNNTRLLSLTFSLCLFVNMVHPISQWSTNTGSVFTGLYTVGVVYYIASGNYDNSTSILLGGVSGVLAGGSVYAILREYTPGRKYKFAQKIVADAERSVRTVFSERVESVFKEMHGEKSYYMVMGHHAFNELYVKLDAAIVALDAAMSDCEDRIFVAKCERVKRDGLELMGKVDEILDAISHSNVYETQVYANERDQSRERVEVARSYERARKDVEAGRARHKEAVRNVEQPRENHPLTQETLLRAAQRDNRQRVLKLEEAMQPLKSKLSWGTLEKKEVEKLRNDVLNTEIGNADKQRLIARIDKELENSLKQKELLREQIREQRAIESDMETSRNQRVLQLNAEIDMLEGEIRDAWKWTVVRELEEKLVRLRKKILDESPNLKGDSKQRLMDRIEKELEMPLKNREREISVEEASSMWR